MSDTISVNVDGATVIIEAQPVYGSEYTNAQKAIEKVEDAFERARSTVNLVASGMIQTVRSMSEDLTPDQFELEFGIKFSVDGTVLVASVSSETTLKVKLIYNSNVS